jgi:hypothetical protein
METLEIHVSFSGQFFDALSLISFFFAVNNGPLISLCEQFLRQNRKPEEPAKPQVTHVTDFQQSPVMPLSQMTSFGGNQFPMQPLPIPATGETMRGTSKVVMAPGTPGELFQRIWPKYQYSN